MDPCLTVELPIIRTINSVFQFAEFPFITHSHKKKKMSTKNIANFIKKIHEKPFLSGAKLRKVGDSFLVSVTLTAAYFNLTKVPKVTLG